MQARQKGGLDEAVGNDHEEMSMRLPRVSEVKGWAWEVKGKRCVW